MFAININDKSKYPMLLFNTQICDPKLLGFFFLLGSGITALKFKEKSDSNCPHNICIKNMNQSTFCL